MKKFGTFEFDVRGRELRKGGIRIRLQDQPFEILAMMLERPGEVVTREELRRQLWPAGTFVDFDHSLNAAVKRLRGSSAGILQRRAHRGNDHADWQALSRQARRAGAQLFHALQADLEERE